MEEEQGGYCWQKRQGRLPNLQDLVQNGTSGFRLGVGKSVSTPHGPAAPTHHEWAAPKRLLPQCWDVLRVWIWCGERSMGGSAGGG